MSRWLRITGATLRFGAAATLAALTVRLAESSSRGAYAAWERIDRAGTSNTAPSASADTKLGPALAKSAKAARSADPAPPTKLGTRPKRPGAVVPGTLVRVPISVQVEPNGSSVLVDQKKQGVTPFVGEVTCTAGERVGIEVVPPRGAKLRFEQPCDGNAIRLR